MTEFLGLIELAVKGGLTAFDIYRLYAEGKIKRDDVLMIIQFSILAKFENLDRRLESIEKRLEGLDRRFESIEKRLDLLDRRLYEIRDELSETRKSLGVVLRHINEILEMLVTKK